MNGAGQISGIYCVLCYVRNEVVKVWIVGKLVRGARYDGYIASTGKEAFGKTKANAFASADDDVVLLTHDLAELFG